MEKKRIENFEDLRVWQKGIELVKQVYFLTAAGKLSKDFGLRDQLQRAAVSVPTNIAEGNEMARKFTNRCHTPICRERQAMQKSQLPRLALTRTGGA